MRRSIAIAILIACLFTATTGYIVDSVNGNDNNDGETTDSPFKTISRCAEALANPGEECQIRDGHYHEVVAVSGLQGRVVKNVYDPFYQRFVLRQSELEAMSRVGAGNHCGRCAG